MKSRLRMISTTQVEASETKIYDISNMINILRNIGIVAPFKDNKKIEWYDIPIAFDIETSSFYHKGEKRACMYVWTLSICGYIVMGRTWEELVQALELISNFYNLGVMRRMVIYVHNFAYEFQFMRKWFEWESIFALLERKPILGLTTLGIEFRCSYLLSGYSLENLAKNVHCVDIRKLKGDLDYSKLRTPLTPLTNEEKAYCINDVQIIIGYIVDLFDMGYNMSTLPRRRQALSELTPATFAFMVPNMEKTRKYI